MTDEHLSGHADEYPHADRNENLPFLPYVWESWISSKLGSGSDEHPEDFVHPPSQCIRSAVTCGSISIGMAPLHNRQWWKARTSNLCSRAA